MSAALFVGDDQVAPQINPTKAAGANPTRSAAHGVVAGDDIILNGHGRIGGDIETLACVRVIQIPHAIDAATVVAGGVADDPIVIDQGAGVAFDPDSTPVVVVRCGAQDNAIKGDLR